MSEVNFQITIKRLRVSRSLRLRVLPNATVLVTAPKYASQRAIQQFIQENQEWIERNITEVHSKLSSLTEKRETLFYRGQEYQFRVNVQPKDREGIQISGQQIIVTTKSEKHEAVRAVLEKWMRKQAELRFKERVPLLADLVEKDVERVTIRSQRSRWGSCSSRNTISLNWRLIMTPDFVSDYVIYHELAHLTHMNHSSKFWNLVLEYCPKYKTAERWLRDHSRLLQF